jgi:hypothetical protein
MGTDVWRRIEMSGASSLLDTHRLIQTLFGWKGGYGFRFLSGDKALDAKLRLNELNGATGLTYEYGAWIVKLMLLSASELDKAHPLRCIAGADAPPPETLDGPIRFRRYLGILENGNPIEKRKVERELGEDFDPLAFNIEACNTMLKELDNDGNGK